MRTFTDFAAACSGAAMLALLAVPAHAQALYSCKTGNGQYMQSYSPCSSSASNGLVYYPPVESSTSSERQPQRYEPPPQRAQEAEAHVKHMNPTCAGLNDALRTASSRGISGISDMRRDYRSKCQENENEAYERLSSAKKLKAA